MRIRLITAYLCLFVTVAAAAQQPKKLTVETSAVGKSYLAYGGQPLFAFGPGDEMRIINGAADLPRWAEWQRAHGMNLIRAYPVSVPLGAYGAEGLHPFLQRDGKWDVDAWNDAYFEQIRQSAKALEEHGIILHLQLWQIVYFKDGGRRWQINYLNPTNNINEWTASFGQGRQYIDAPADSPARRHQQQWVRRILDALHGRGNVIIDVINELGNGMGTLEWAAEVVGWIRQWETERNWTFIVGVDSEHHYHPDRFGPYTDVFDLIILNELRSRTFAQAPIKSFNMPAVSVRSSDGLNQRRDYLFLDPDSVGPEHQTRYRTLCYRSLFSGLQSIGAYWKSQVADADYRQMQEWPTYAEALRTFWTKIAPHWPVLRPDIENPVVFDAPTPHAYALTSPDLYTVYLECGSHTYNNAYPASTLRIRCPFETPRVECFNPRTGETKTLNARRKDDALLLDLPAFTDDLALLIWK